MIKRTPVVTINDNIWENAKAKIQRKKKLEEYLHDCAVADICPKCGGDRQIEWYTREDHRLLQGWSRWARIICSNPNCDWKIG